MATNRLKGDDCERDWIWEREVETAPWEETRRISAGAWERQYRRLRESSPFYARKFREAGAGNSFVSLGDLTQLPFTTKEELKQALDEDPPFGSNLCVSPDQVKRVYQTSGTSGVPSVLALTRGDMESWTLMGTRTYYATGIHEHSSVLTTFGAGPFVAGHTHFVLLRIGVRSVPVAPGDTERVVFGLRAGLADTLLSTASFAQYLANRLEKTEAEPSSIPLTHVVTGGEPGGGIPAIRDHIQRVLGVTVTEVMGIGDIAPSLFGECTHQQGMHFCGAGHVWVERGVNVYPTAILSVVGDFRPRVTGRARVVREGSATSIEPPIPIEVEVTERHESDPALVAEIEAAIHSKLMFRGRVQLVPESDFGEAGYKTKLTVRR